MKATTLAAVLVAVVGVGVAAAVVVPRLRGTAKAPAANGQGVAGNAPAPKPAVGSKDQLAAQGIGLATELLTAWNNRGARAAA